MSAPTVVPMPSSPAVDPARVASLLGAGSLWGPIQGVAVTGSTNDDLSRRAAIGADEGEVLVADHQTGGHGRFQRPWQDVPGTAVALSVLLRPRRPAAEWGWLSLAAGVAVVNGLRHLAPEQAHRVMLKWPNDVLIDDRKVCGILASSDGSSVVVGLGINTTMDASELPVPQATSLLLAGLPAGKDELVAAVLASLERVYAQWQGSGELRAPYQAACGTIGRSVRVQLDPHRAVHGIATGVDRAGGLVVSTPAGQRAFAAGDVHHLR